MLLNCGIGEDSQSPLDYKEIQPVHSKGDQSWVFIGRTDVEAETPIFWRVLWPPHVKSWLIWKDPDAGKDWGKEEKGTTEDEMVGWHHQLNGHGFEWTLGVGDGLGGLVCCGSWGRKESDMTERLNWTELNSFTCYFHVMIQRSGLLRSLPCVPKHPSHSFLCVDVAEHSACANEMRTVFYLVLDGLLLLGSLNLEFHPILQKKGTRRNFILESLFLKNHFINLFLK